MAQPGEVIGLSLKSKLKNHCLKLINKKNYYDNFIAVSIYACGFTCCLINHRIAFAGIDACITYPVFRDACARSVGLTSLGKTKARYAVLYPQYELEQSDPFMDSFSPDDPALVSLTNIAAAIYQSGENFDFIFPENLVDLTVRDGRIVLRNSEFQN